MLEVRITGGIDIERAIDEMSGKEAKKVVNTALRQGGNILKRQTVKNFKTAVKTNRSGISKAVKVGKSTKDSKGVYVKVYILGSRKKGLKEYVAAILERGSYKVGRRYTKKDKNRGVLEGRGYFAKAQDQTEGKVWGEFSNRLEKGLIKIWNKKNG